MDLKRSIFSGIQVKFWGLQFWFISVFAGKNYRTWHVIHVILYLIIHAAGLKTGRSWSIRVATRRTTPLPGERWRHGGWPLACEGRDKGTRTTWDQRAEMVSWLVSISYDISNFKMHPNWPPHWQGTFYLLPLCFSDQMHETAWLFLASLVKIFISKQLIKRTEGTPTYHLLTVCPKIVWFQDDHRWSQPRDAAGAAGSPSRTSLDAARVAADFLCGGCAWLDSI